MALPDLTKTPYYVGSANVPQPLLQREARATCTTEEMSFTYDQGTASERMRTNEDGPGEYIGIDTAESITSTGDGNTAPRDIVSNGCAEEGARDAMTQDLFGPPSKHRGATTVGGPSSRSAAAPPRDSAEAAVHNLPLSFLRQHEHLRPIALEKGLRMMCKPFVKFAVYILGRSLTRWREAVAALKRREEQRRDMQLSYQMIAKVLLRALDRCLDRRFQHWARACCSRYQADHLRAVYRASLKIQRFVRKSQRGVVSLSPQFRSAFSLCMSRRRAVKGAVEFHRQRDRAIKKLRLAVLYRRRMFFAARVIQRAFRWYRVMKYVRRRLERRMAARAIRRWWLRLFRSWTLRRRALVAYIVSHGGYYRMRRKVPRVYRCTGVLFGINMSACRIQKWYRHCVGMFHLHVKVAARRRRIDFERRMHRFAVIIQNTFRAFMWKVLLLKMMQNNRARRIQRGYRAHQYREWTEAALERRRIHKAVALKNVILRLVGRWRLNVRFRLREQRIKLEIAQRNEAASRIKHAYASRKLQRNYESQRKDRITGIMERYRLLRINAVRRLQRFYRLIMRPDLAGRHLLICAQRHALLIYQRESAAARSIQRYFRPYIDCGMAITGLRKANAQLVLRRMFTSYSLRAEIDRRAYETLETKVRAVNVISKLFSHRLWMKVLNRRFEHMRYKLDHAREVDRCARIIQIAFRNKMREYNMPLRIAAR